MEIIRDGIRECPDQLNMVGRSGMVGFVLSVNIDDTADTKKKIENLKIALNELKSIEDRPEAKK